MPKTDKVTPVTSRISPWLSPLLYFVGRYFLPFYFGQLNFTGQENLPRTGPVILASTHRSRWDGLIVAYATGRLVTRRDLRFIVSANETGGLQGWFVRRMGGFPLDPEHPGFSSLRHSVELLCQGEALAIFPEGDIYRDGHVNPLKPGLARIALQAQSHQSDSSVKIVPISIGYAQVYPSCGCDVKVKIGSPMDVADYSHASAKKSAPKLTADLEAILKELHEERVSQNSLPTPTA
ncbi:MAG: 1-acyl-sn-glycerol-3-phosphate acyltransferase [Cyanobacteria bacterium QH_1_48_107]|nr:MAG: 1-acyl-sn-glycerol-3-phosphate acyltransferase [Cyanobacteria bacterium QH_1_48_107]